MKLTEVMAARSLGEYTDEMGQAWRLKRTPMRVTAEIRAKSQSPRVLVDLKDINKGYKDGDFDFPKYASLKVAFALVEPELDGSTLEERAACLTELLTQREIERLFEHSLILDDLELARKVEEEVKN